MNFKFSVKLTLEVKVKAETFESTPPEVDVKNSGLKPNANLSENLFCKYKATPYSLHHHH